MIVVVIVIVIVVVVPEIIDFGDAVELGSDDRPSFSVPNGGLEWPLPHPHLPPEISQESNDSQIFRSHDIFSFGTFPMISSSMAGVALRLANGCRTAYSLYL